MDLAARVVNCPGIVPSIICTISSSILTWRSSVAMVELELELGASLTGACEPSTKDQKNVLVNFSNKPLSIKLHKPDKEYS